MLSKNLNSRTSAKRAMVTAVLLLGAWTGGAWADTALSNQVAIAATTDDAALATESSSEFVNLLQDLAPLPVLALGFLGLIWIRRHTADL